MSCWLVLGALTSGCVTKEVKVPVPPPMCRLPAFHVQAECHADIDCLLAEFALTLQAERAVKEAFAPCKWIIQNVGQRGV